ncbi:ficolin-2-like [Patiria miniata]|uniref:Fibrinogen C-terminal domain-containing protein n=1 Tax=Patiria miniata TaxID=46514 RepID=A0A914ABC3_PATMI|nr:ficolin-2-like [Patiria miniata]
MAFVIEALFLALVAKTCLCQCPNISFVSPREFYFANNRVLQGYVFQKNTVSSAVICGRDCSMDPQCASFNYHANSHICELNNQTRIQSPCALVSRQGSIFFDDNYETSFFSVPYAGKYPSCKMLLRAGIMCESDVYTIYPSGMAEGLQVYCDMETDGGGWTVFQRRQDGSVDFYRNWVDYQSGFGDLSGEFWLGNEALRILTETGQWQLRVDLEDWEGNTAWAEYSEFGVSGQNYALHVGSYNGMSTAGDALQYLNTYPFTTKDQDNDIHGTLNCANRHEGAWWFGKCFTNYGAHLNGKYIYCQPPCDSTDMGLQWYAWSGHFKIPLKQSDMRMREVS